MSRRVKQLSRTRLSMMMSVALLGGAGEVAAFEIETGNSDVTLRWDTTAKYSAASRVSSRSQQLIANPNLDDGDRNFNKGLISNRFDMLTEADVGYKGFGARISAAGWYDSVYQGNGDHDSPFTNNTTSAPSPGFPVGTQKLHGNKTELLDAFVYGRFDLGESSRLNVKAGRHAIQWGESLFFGSNAIAGGMAPVDLIKLLSVPNTQFKEVIRPVGQVSAQLQFAPNLAVGGYVQYKWEASRVPGAGSYFSFADLAPSTGEGFIVGPGPKATHASDVDAKNSGQGGLQLRWRPEGLETDVGFYAIRYHDKFPQQYLTLASAAGGPKPFNYYFVYPQGIDAFGMSASRTVREFNLAAELSVRKNAPLVAAGIAQIPAFGVKNELPRGTTWHANFNTIAGLGPNFIAKEASLAAELAINHTSKITANASQVDPNAESTGIGFRMVYEPMYRQVMSGLDLGVPIGLSYSPKGKSSAGGALGPHRGGDFSIGLNATYLSVWKGSLTYTHYYGKEGAFLDAANHQTFLQTLKDRNFIALSISRTF